MKKLYLSLFILGILTSCSKDADLQMVKNGFYSGYANYQGIKYYSSIIIDKNRYSEGASGGVVYQKTMPTLTEGIFSIYEGNLIFNPQRFLMDDSKVWKRNPDLVLDGAFRINFLENDSISFSRGEGDKKVVYLLRRYVENY